MNKIVSWISLATLLIVSALLLPSVLKIQAATIKAADPYVDSRTDTSTSSVAALDIAEVALPVVCTATGFYRDGINLTAARINPVGTVSGDVDATGCNIAIYYGPGQTGTVNHANVHGANYYGVLNHKANVNVKNSSVHDIGEVPLNGSQHGVAVYYANVDAPVGGAVCSSTGNTRGDVDSNTISNYQKGGIVASCTRTNAEFKDNTVTGQGHVNYIAQNGIQVGYGARALVSGNTVTGNSYTGSSASSAGVLVVGGPVFGGSFSAYVREITVERNTLTNNDVGVYLYNTPDGTAPPPAGTKTGIDVVRNTIHSDGLFNGYPYQAGIADIGRADTITRNTITGNGYSALAHPGQAYGIDADPNSYSPQVKIQNNNVVP